MKKQVVFIHGGEAFTSYEMFLEYLRTEEVDPYQVKPKRWHQTLLNRLGEEYEVFTPSMPNKENAKYREWKLWFEKYIPFLRDGVVLIGHSLGGNFLGKYLIENDFPVSIGALMLVAAAYGPADFGGEDGGDFVFDTSLLHKLQNAVNQVVIFHSKDDFVVPYTHAQKYAAALTHAQLVTFEDRNHFLQLEFPELIESIKGVG
jgi:predicted alpha/beta hydrolase family esterase